MLALFGIVLLIAINLWCCCVLGGIEDDAMERFWERKEKEE